MKTVTYVIGTIALLTIVFFAFTPKANAQFRPCVWPNTCIN